MQRGLLPDPGVPVGRPAQAEPSPSSQGPHAPIPCLRRGYNVGLSRLLRRVILISVCIPLDSAVCRPLPARIQPRQAVAVRQACICPENVPPNGGDPPSAGIPAGDPSNCHHLAITDSGHGAHAARDASGYGYVLRNRSFLFPFLALRLRASSPPSPSPPSRPSPVEGERAPARASAWCYPMLAAAHPTRCKIFHPDLPAGRASLARPLHSSLHVRSSRYG